MSIDDAETDLLDTKITAIPSLEEARIGVYFQYDELIKVLPSTQAKKMLKASRMAKWLKMVTFGLD